MYIVVAILKPCLITIAMSHFLDAIQYYWYHFGSLVAFSKRIVERVLACVLTGAHGYSN